MIQLLVLGLACWRLTSLINTESGPYNILARFRHVVGIEIDKFGQPYGKNQFAEMFSCSWCLSVWIGLLLGVTYYFWRDVWWIALPLALSAVAIIIERIVRD